MHALRAFNRVTTWIVAGAYTLFCSALPIRKRSVLIQSHNGHTLFGNPFYVAQLMATEDRHFSVICVSRQPEADHTKLAVGSRRIKWVRPGSVAYLVALATASHLVCDTSFPPYFVRRKRQRYLNTWHGTPLKALGTAVPETLNANLRNMQRNFLQATDILFPNDHTETVLTRDFGLTLLWRGNAIRCGYPRNDVLLGRSARRDTIEFHVAYMPTWRGTHSTLGVSSRKHAQDVAAFLEAFEGSSQASVMLWVKLHPLMSSELDLSDYHNVREFPRDVETYQHLATCHALVTDYSSVMIDFAAADRLVVLYAPDLAQYTKNQNFSLPIETLPFPIFSTPERLLRAMEQLKRGSPPCVNHLLESLTSRDNGTSTTELCDKFFNDPPPENAEGFSTHNLALIVIEKALTPHTKTGLLSAIEAVHAAGLKVIVATPGDRSEDTMLVRIVKERGDIVYCPSTSANIYGGWPPFNKIVGGEQRRLFGNAKFVLLLRADECPSYARLAAEFPPHASISFSLDNERQIGDLRRLVANSVFTTTGQDR